jgi:hypothetical protein
MRISFLLDQGGLVDWHQNASAAIVFIRATKTLRKKPHIVLKKALIPLKMFLKNVFTFSEKVFKNI